MWGQLSEAGSDAPIYVAAADRGGRLSHACTSSMKLETAD